MQKKKKIGNTKAARAAGIYATVSSFPKKKKN